MSLHVDAPARLPQYGAPTPAHAEPRPPTPAWPVPPADSEPLFNLGLARDLFSFVRHALRRRAGAALFAFCSVLAAAGLALVVLPRSYVTEAKLLAERNVVMPVLGNPSRKLPTETDTPTRLASEAVLDHHNLTAIVYATDLLSHWRAERPLAMRLRDEVRGWITGPDSKEDQVSALVWMLSRNLTVTTGDGTVTIHITWPDPDMAYRIVQTAAESFIEERHAEELSLITESIGILEGHAAEVNAEIKATLDTMARDRAAIAPSVPAPLFAALQRAAPNAEVVSTQSRLESVRRTIQDLEQYRSRRLADMQAALADQRGIYGEAHPQIENTKQLIISLSTDSPQLVQLRQQEQQLRLRLRELGAEADASRGSAADPFLAAAAVRSLERLHVDSLLGEKEQYSRARLRIAVRSYEQLLEHLDAAQIELETTRAAFKYKYGVLVPPERPKQALKPRPATVIVSGALLACILALFAAVALDVAAGRALEPWQVERALGLPVLGEVPSP
jgi:uncharacterized protein involved in exopolysaccharide biosynthesis